MTPGINIGGLGEMWDQLEHLMFNCHRKSNFSTQHWRLNVKKKLKKKMNIFLHIPSSWVKIWVKERKKVQGAVTFTFSLFSSTIKLIFIVKCWMICWLCSAVLCSLKCCKHSKCLITLVTVREQKILAFTMAGFAVQNL